MRSFILSLIFFLSCSLMSTAANDCEIGEVVVEVLPCGDGGYFKVEIDFDYAHVGDEGFRVVGNGNEYGNFEYANLPIIINGLNGDGQTEYEFVVIDNQFEECSNWGGIDPVDCGVDECWISELNIDDNPCEDGYYSVFVNFEYEHVSEEGFKLFLDEELFGVFDYEELPIEVGPLVGDGEKVYHFLVRDQVYEGCASDKDFGAIDCDETDCFIGELIIENHPCDGEYYDVDLAFEYENVSDHFKLYINDDLYGEYGYEELPLTLGPFEESNTYHYLVKDINVEGCASDANYGPIDCDGDCLIWDVEADVLDCNEAGFFGVAINFEYINVGNEGFRIQGNGQNYGNFEYEALPVTIEGLIGDGETVYEFVVIDNQDEECSDWTEIEPVDCGGEEECFIGELIIENYPCQDGFYAIDFNFEYDM